MTVWRKRCSEFFGNHWGAEVAYIVDGAIRPPYKTEEVARDIVFVRDSVLADDKATLDTKWERFE